MANLALADLRTLVAALLSADLDNYLGESATGSTLDPQINWAYRSICRRLKLFSPNIGLKLAENNAIYDLTDVTTPHVYKRVVRPFAVWINHTPLLDCARQDYGLWTWQELVREKPNYLNQTANAPGTPTVAVFNGSDKLILDPAPSTAYIASLSANDGTLCYIAGTYIPADLSSATPGTTDIPDIPDELHECIAQLAAIKAAVPVASDAVAWQRLAEMGNDWTTAVAEKARENESDLSSWGTTTGSKVPDYLWI